MTAIREQILEAKRVRFAAISGFTGLTCERNKSFPDDEENVPSLNIIDGDQHPIENAGAFVLMQMVTTVEGIVKADEEGGQGTAVNALYNAVVKSVGVDPSWGGLAIDTREGAMSVAIDRSRGAPFVASFQLELIVDFMVRDGAPDQLAP